MLHFVDRIIDVLVSVWYYAAGLALDAKDVVFKIVKFEFYLALLGVVLFVVSFIFNSSIGIAIAAIFTGLFLFFFFLTVDGLVVFLAALAGEGQRVQDIKTELRKALRPFLTVSMIVAFMACVVSIKGTGYVSFRDIIVWGTIGLVMATWTFYTGFDRGLLAKLVMLGTLFFLFGHYLFPTQRIIMTKWINAWSSYSTSIINRSVAKLRVDAQSTYAKLKKSAYCQTKLLNLPYIKLNKGESVLVLGLAEPRKALSHNNQGYSQNEAIYWIKRADEFGQFSGKGVVCLVPARFLGDDQVASEYWETKEKASEKLIKAKKPEQKKIAHVPEWKMINSGILTGKGFKYSNGRDEKLLLVAKKKDLRNGDIIVFESIAKNSSYSVPWANFTQGDIRSGQYQHRISRIENWLEDGVYSRVKKGGKVYFRHFRKL